MTDKLEKELTESKVLTSQDGKTVTDPESNNNEKISIEELALKLDQINKKLVRCSAPSQYLKTQIEQIIQELEELKKETLEKKNFVSEQMKLVNEKVDQLVRAKKIRTNDDERKQSEQNIQQYIHLLESVAQEIEQESSYFAQFLKEDHPTLIVVPKYSPSDFDSYLDEKIKWSKRYAKNIRKSTSVSFSRYQFSFEEQIKKLDYMQAYFSEESGN